MITTAELQVQRWCHQVQIPPSTPPLTLSGRLPEVESRCPAVVLPRHRTPRAECPASSPQPTYLYFVCVTLLLNETY